MASSTIQQRLPTVNMSHQDNPPETEAPPTPPGVNLLVPTVFRREARSELRLYQFLCVSRSSA